MIISQGGVHFDRMKYWQIAFSMERRDDTKKGDKLGKGRLETIGAFE